MYLTILDLKEGGHGDNFEMSSFSSWKYTQAAKKGATG